VKFYYYFCTSKSPPLHQVRHSPHISSPHLSITEAVIFSPDEYPFTTDLPEPVLPRLEFPAILYPNKINVNPSILSFYTCSIVPRITRRATLALAAKKRAQGIIGNEEYEDDGNYGSAATLDVEVLQSISKRVHYGRSDVLWVLVWVEPYRS